MGAGALVVAWTCSVLAISGSARVEAFTALPRLPLALFPWLALAGLPRPGPRRAGEASAPAAAALACAAAAGPLALAWNLDRVAGFAQAGAVLVPGLGLTFALAVAARLAARDPRASAWHGAAWTAIVVLVPALAAVLAWDGAAGGGPLPWLDAVAGTSPLDWVYDCCARPGEVGWRRALPPLGACAALWVLAATRRTTGGAA